MSAQTEAVSGESSRRTARTFYYGNMLAVLVPFPFFILWFGASMLVYAMHRHHPNPRVGYYTQIGAYQYYGLAGLLVPVLTFAPGDFFVNYWLPLWLLCAGALIPLAVWQLMKINKEQWQDVQVNK